MTDQLLDLATSKLLEKFGSGNHKPGSGSAAALVGILSGQLIKTVVSLTLKKKKYKDIHDQLAHIAKDVDNVLIPKLKHLFQEDSERFDENIKLRKRRMELDISSEEFKKIVMEEEESLKICTQLPYNIAILCMELARHGLFIFNYGFKSARGDSGVALETALSAVAGCLSIINLNLLKIQDRVWFYKFQPKIENLRDEWEILTTKAYEQAKALEDERKTKIINQSRAFFESFANQDRALTSQEIEVIVKELQNSLWVNRDGIWKNNETETLHDILQPGAVLEHFLGYKYITIPSLGSHEVEGELFDVAGVIDKTSKSVTISTHLSLETQNFTAAHELGHAILHSQNIQHRDRPRDGSSVFKDSKEFEADKFATFFLMPDRLVRRIFKEVFSRDKIVLDNQSIIEFYPPDIKAFLSRFRSIREFTREVVSLESFAGKKVNPMHKVFRVSVETMAIRLEELDLIDTRGVF